MTLTREHNITDKERSVSVKITPQQQPVPVCDKIVSSEIEHRLTLMLLLGSFTYAGSFASYLFVKLYFRIYKGQGPEIELHFVVQCLLKLTYMTGVVNPWLCFVFNLKCRQFLKNCVLCEKP